MIRSLAAIAAALALLAFAPLVARAQVDARAVSFGIGGGTSIPVRDTRTAYRTGFNGGAFLRVDLGTLPLSFRADCIYQNFELRPAAIPPAGTPGGGTGTLLGGLGDALLYMRHGGVRPYLIGGVGVYAVRAEFDANDLPTKTETRLGAHGGAGLLLTFGSLALYAEGTLDHLAPRAGAPSASAIQVVPVTVGVIF
jgi:hypothetical protein